MEQKTPYTPCAARQSIPICVSTGVPAITITGLIMSVLLPYLGPVQCGTGPYSALIISAFSRYRKQKRKFSYSMKRSERYSRSRAR